MQEFKLLQLHSLHGVTKGVVHSAVLWTYNIYSCICTTYDRRPNFNVLSRTKLNGFFIFFKSFKDADRVGNGISFSK